MSKALSDESLLIPTGAVFIGPKSTGVVKGSRKTAQEGQITHEVLSAKKN